MSAKDVLRVREEARTLTESVHAAQWGYLLLDAKGQALVRVIEKGEDLPVSLLMVRGPSLHGEERLYANQVAAYVRLGVEQFLDERRKDAENEVLALSMWDEENKQAVLVTAFESHWGVLSLSGLFPWPWPASSPSSPPSRDEGLSGRGLATTDAGGGVDQAEHPFLCGGDLSNVSAGAGSPSPSGSASTAWRSCCTRGAIRRSRIRRRAG
jgi:hypothetical protein